MSGRIPAPGPLIPGQGRQVLLIFTLLSLSDREKCLQDAYGGGEAEEGVQPGLAASPWSGLPYSHPSSSSRLALPALPGDVWLSPGDSGGPSPCAASEQPESCPMLSPPFPQPLATASVLSQILPPSLHAQAPALVCWDGMGQLHPCTEGRSCSLRSLQPPP